MTRAVPTRKRRKRASKEPEYAAAARLAKLRTILESGGGTVDDFAQRLGVTRRSIFRYLNLLSLTDPLVEDEIEGRKAWRFERATSAASAKRTSVRLTTTQLIALRLALGQMRALEGTGLHEDLAEVCAELEATLRRADFALARGLDTKLFDVGEAPYDYAERTDDLDAIVTALLKEARLSITHEGSRGARTFEIDPYTLMHYRRGLYVVAYSHEHNAVRTFGLDAVSDVRWMKGARFEYPKDYDPSKLVDGAFGIIQGTVTRVRLRFAPEMARYIARRKWHPTLALTRAESGALEATMDVAGTGELTTWILSFGSKCEVLEPPRLREDVARELRMALGAYEGE